jgi:hypothetical protein
MRPKKSFRSGVHRAKGPLCRPKGAVPPHITLSQGADSRTAALMMPTIE